MQKAHFERVPALEHHVGHKRVAEVEESEEEGDLHDSPQSLVRGLLFHQRCQHFVLDSFSLLLGRVSHDIRHVTQNDEFNEEGDEYPNWAVEL